MSRHSITPSPKAIMNIEGLTSDIDKVLAEALSRVEVDNPYLKDISLDTEDGFAKAAQVAAAKARSVQNETNDKKTKPRLQSFADKVIRESSRTLSQYQIGKKALRLAPVAGLILGACGPVESATTDINTPTAGESISTPIPEAPKPGAEDEMNVAVQEYLNEEMEELRLFGAEAIPGQLSSGGEKYILAQSSFAREDSQEFTVPILTKLNESGGVQKALLLQAHPEYDGEEYLITGEFNAYGYDPETGSLVDYGPKVRLMRTGEILIFSENNWASSGIAPKFKEEILDFLEKNIGSQELANSVSIVEAASNLEEESYPPLEQPESLIIEMDQELLESLVRLSNDHKFVSYAGRADEIIQMMGVEQESELADEYRSFFDTQWFINWSDISFRRDIRGLGWDNAEGKYITNQDIGFFYGFVDSGSGYLILQTEPGSNLTPESNPESFLAVELSFPINVRGARTNYLSMIVVRSLNEHGRLQEFTLDRVGGGVQRESISSENIFALQTLLGLKRGTIISTYAGYPEATGKHHAWATFIFTNEIPSETEVEEYNLTLEKFSNY